MIPNVDEVHYVVETVLSLFSIAFNSFLLYLIMNHSTYDGTIYQFCLTVDASLDLALGIISLLAKPVGFSGDGYLEMVSNNSLKLPSYDTFVLATYFMVLHMNVLWIPMQFAYRYIFVCRLSPNDSLPPKACAVAVVGVLWNCVAFCGTYLMFSPPDDFQPKGWHVLQLNDWPYDTESPPLVFGSYITNVRLIVWLSLWFISSGGGAFVVVICEVKMFRFFREYGNALSANTRRLHKQFHRALLAMAICPLMTTGLPVFFFIITTVLSLAPGPVSAFFTTALSSIAVFNPITTIFFMPCCRDVVFRRLRKKHRSVADVTDVAGLEATNEERFPH